MQRVLHQRGATVVKYIQEHSEHVTSQEALELYKWGMSLVQSRALTFRGRKYLCPLADMFNYEPRNDKREANAGESFLRYHQLSSDGLQIFADRDCAAGALCSYLLAIWAFVGQRFGGVVNNRCAAVRRLRRQQRRHLLLVPWFYPFHKSISVSRSSYCAFFIEFTL